MRCTIFTLFLIFLLIWFDIANPFFLCSFLTGNHVQNWKNKWNILQLQFRCCNWLWSGCFLVSSFRGIIANGSHKVHVLWEALNTWRKSSVVHYIFSIFLVWILNYYTISILHYRRSEMLYKNDIICFKCLLFVIHVKRILGDFISASSLRV